MYPKWFFSFPITFMQKWFLQTIKAYFETKNIFKKIFLFLPLLPTLLLTPLIYLFSGLSWVVTKNPIPITIIGPLWPIMLWILFVAAFPFLLILRLSLGLISKPKRIIKNTNAESRIIKKKVRPTFIILLTIGILGTIAGITLLVLVVIQSINMMPGDTSQRPLIILMLAVFSGGSIVFGISFAFARPKYGSKFASKYTSIYIEKKNAQYATYPLQKITNYQKEIEETRNAFAIDTDPRKNMIRYQENKKLNRFTMQYMSADAIAQYNSIDYKSLYDYTTIDVGKIYYGCLVMANSMVFVDKKANINSVYPGVVLYSIDAYYESNPTELIPIANRLFAEKENNILKNETDYFYHYELPPDAEGRKLYMTTIMIDRTLLPMNRFSARIFPIIVAPEQSKSVFIVDDKFWTKNLISSYIHNNFDKEDDDSSTIFGNGY